MKKIVTVALSLLFICSAVACNNNTKTETEDEVADNTYLNTYTGLYDKSVGTLTDYNMYTDVETVTKTYEEKEYPGNEQYLNEVKASYKDSKEKIQSFIDGLKNDVKTDDAELNEMNKSLIAEGEKSIKDIDAKIAKLDKITKEDYDKPQNEFIKLVDDTVKAGENITNDFVNMLKNMDERLGINRNNE